MRKGGRRITAVALLCGVLAGSSACGQTLGPVEADLSVLFVGNSLTYSNDLPGMVTRLLREHADVGTVHVEQVAFPNFGLFDHWIDGTARQRIAAGGWDVVVIQQGPSATEGRPSLIEFTGHFAQAARDNGGRVGVYMVWPSRARSFDFDGVVESHVTAAADADALLYPAGEAWRIAWAEDPDLPLYGPDGFHPSGLGSYLAALVMYEQLSGRSAHSLPDVVVAAGGDVPLGASTARILKDAASEANRRFARPN